MYLDKVYPIVCIVDNTCMAVYIDVHRECLKHRNTKPYYGIRASIGLIAKINIQSSWFTYPLNYGILQPKHTTYSV